MLDMSFIMAFTIVVWTYFIVFTVLNWERDKKILSIKERLRTIAIRMVISCHKK